MPRIMSEKIFDLKEVAAYQTEAVVSKTLLDKPEGTITVFSFDAGEGLSEHTSPYDAVVHVLDGEADITIAGTVHTVKAGELIIMPAQKPHSLRAKKRFKMMLIMIRAKNVK